VKKRVLLSVGLAVFLLATLLVSTLLASAVTPYEEYGCGHLVHADPVSKRASGVWVTSDPMYMETTGSATSYPYRSLVVASAEITLTEVSTQSVWGCFYDGEMSVSRRQELLGGILPRAYNVNVYPTGGVSRYFLEMIPAIPAMILSAEDLNVTLTFSGSVTDTFEGFVTVWGSVTPMDAGWNSCADDCYIRWVYNPAVYSFTALTATSVTASSDIHGFLQQAEVIAAEATPIPSETPGPPPLAVDFNVNSPDGGFGEVVTTTQRFDLVAGVRSTEPVSQEVMLGFFGVQNPETWELYQAEGLSGTWTVSTETQSILWEGALPGTNLIEVWIHSPDRIVSPQSTVEYELVVGVAEEDYGSITKFVTVHNPSYGIYLPLVGQNFVVGPPATTGEP